ncbi:hypothetical protein ROZALSC1DRAFT_26768 [Rozella allomycis CSF55]|uniref:Uncharacterized protein n=1 Tax=Rozella allomycis (strain CSF55) TaxID=988480 RepID=A0A075AVH8_ROZAC|nr:hypothetical protein O9G_002321 [Rozella allomycis CSF55]RKP21836.1 hypothetical protein ROZALSC1DRAFT_26768 [Rozella allomycis CSF55]|eukprot:EPZ32544.1 hypothetical protein O9G_002321 [Rozella allomycis CSF55]
MSMAVIVHTILFHRLIVPCEPVDLEFKELDIVYPTLGIDNDIIAQKVRQNSWILNASVQSEKVEKWVLNVKLGSSENERLINQIYHISSLSLENETIISKQDDYDNPSITYNIK